MDSMGTRRMMKEWGQQLMITALRYTNRAETSGGFLPLQFTIKSTLYRILYISCDNSSTNKEPGFSYEAFLKLPRI